MAQAEAHFIYRLQTVGGFGGKSDQLNAYNVLRGDPASLPRDLAALPRRHARDRCAQAARAYPALRSPRRSERRAARPAGAGAAGSEPVSVS